MAAETNLETRIGTWVSAHHIVLYVLLMLAILGGVYAVEAKRAEVAEAKTEAAQQALVVEKDHGKQLADLYAQNEAQREKDIAQYKTDLASIKSQSQIQIVHDKALPAPQLGQRIESITGFKAGTITLDAAQDLVVPQTVAQDIVGKLDEGIADAATVDKLQDINDLLSKTIADQTIIIAQDKIILTGQIKADGDALSGCQTKATKGKLKWFGIGFVAGFISREVIKP